MNTKQFSLRARLVVLAAAMAGGFYCLSSFARQSQKTNAEVRVSQEDGLMTAIFRTPSGGRVSAFMPLTVLSDDTEAGGTVERQLPPQVKVADAKTADEDANEIGGVVSIQPHNKQPNFPPVLLPPDTPGFRCPPSRHGGTDITYTPIKGPPTTVTLPPAVQLPPTEVPLPTVPPTTTTPPTETPPTLLPALASNPKAPLLPAAAQPANTCGIPQLTTSNGNMHVSMAGNGDPSKNMCIIGGIPANCRAWSGTGATFHVAPSSQLPPGLWSVVVVRGNQMAMGKTHAAKVTMTLDPAHLQPGQPCTITTTAYCPGLEDVKGATLVIKNYNPAVLNMPDKVIPIRSNPSSQVPSTCDLVKRDELKTIDRVKEKLSNSGKPVSQKLMDNLERAKAALTK